MKHNGMTLLSSLWFTQSGPDVKAIGFILVDTDHGKRAFIGGSDVDMGPGAKDEMDDLRAIMDWGSPLPVEIAKAAFPGYDLGDYRN